MIFNCAYQEKVELHKLIRNPKNNNIHSDEQIDRLAKIIDYQGQRSPIVVSKRSGFIVKGHARLSALEKLGWKHAAVDFQDYESEAQEYADMTADNEIARWAKLDFDAVKLELEDLPEIEVDMLGIEDFELPDVEKIDPQTDEDETPEVKHVPITKRGDVWLLGNHRVMCGDSTMIDDVEKLMNGEKADMVFTDPPYNIAEKTKGVASGAPTNKQNKKLMDSGWDKGFNPDDFLSNLPLILSENSTCYVFTSDFLFGSIFKYFNSFFDFSGFTSWYKPNPFPSLMKRHWCFNTELCLYGTKGRHLFNYPDSGNALSAWSIPIGEGGMHPTQKPIAVPEHAIRHSSKEYSLITDLFLGSGSTLIACEKTDRKCYGMELDEHYCDVIVERWQNYTGKKAVLEETNQLYDELNNV